MKSVSVFKKRSRSTGLVNGPDVLARKDPSVRNGLVAVVCTCMQSGKIERVLFLDETNAALSILAEALLNARLENRYKGRSAGFKPRGVVHPMALKLIRDAGYSTLVTRSKGWAEFSRRGADDLALVVTLSETTKRRPLPVWPGRPPVLHWHVSNPEVALGGETEIFLAFADAQRRIRRLIELLLGLGIHALKSDR